MREMKFDAPAEEVDALFDEWDPDGSGFLELKEIEKLLRRGSTIQLDDKLRAGAVEVDTRKGTNIAIRKGTLDRNNSVLLQGFDVDESSDKSVAEQLRDALSKAAMRVVDLFREWGAPRCSGPRP